MPSDDAILEHIRKRWDYVKDEWRETREEGRLNMRYVAGDPWPPEEKRQRLAAERPCLALDECGQYVNKAINSRRANKRGIKIAPRGNGASDDTAEFNQGLINQIQTDSNADQAYTCCFENQVQRNIGALMVVAEYMDPLHSDIQKLKIERVANPETIFADPDAKQANFADMKDCFVIEEISHDEFRRRWPEAEITNFTTEMQLEHPAWIKDKRVQVAAYWQIKPERTKVWDLDFPDGRKTVTDAEVKEMGGKPVKGGIEFQGLGIIPVKGGKPRTAEEPRVVQYITNGVELLETNTWGGEVTHADGSKRWHGKRIPIIVATGKEIWVDEGSGSKRRILSAVSLARDPIMLYNYYRTNQAEFAGMIPKVPAVGYEGQFEGHEDEWNNANRQPIGFLQAKPVVEQTGGQLLPLPQPRQYDAAPIAVFDGAAESARRAIQAAFGMYEAAVGKSDSRAKSGIAIQRLQEQSEVGTYHFNDNMDMALNAAGEILIDLIPLYYDTPREVAIRQPDEKQKVVQINQPQQPQAGAEDQPQYRTDVGDHDVTVSAGPSYESQRQEVSEFADLLASNPALFQAALQGSPSASKIMALAIRMKNMGPLGDQMADAFAPPDEGQQAIPPQVQQALQQAQQQLQALNAYAAQKDQEVTELKQQMAAKVADNQAKAQMQQAESQSKLQLEQIRVASEERIAQLEAKVDILLQQMKSADVAAQAAHQERQAAFAASQKPNGAPGE